MKVSKKAANTNTTSPTHPASARSPWLLEWLGRLAQPGFSLDMLNQPLPAMDMKAALPASEVPHSEDWHSVTHICGHSPQDFLSAGSPLPLTSAEIEHFRRNHRGTENHITRDFLTAQTDLPSPLAELYGLYLHRARVDTEAALFLAQSTAATRVARTMADLLAVGSFANGVEYIGYLGVTYSVPAAFDTAVQIDRANREALRRLALPAEHPSHLLKLTPDEIGILAASIAEKYKMTPKDFLEKANLLSEARQDVTRLPVSEHFTTAVIERDLPIHTIWMERLALAYARLFPAWVKGLPEIQPYLK